jgi:hypothetical protein
VTVLAGLVFIGQLIGKWHEGALLGFSALTLIAHLVRLSPFGHRDPHQVHHIVHEKARVEGPWPPSSSGRLSRCRSTAIGS